jgi:hypothetical protein
MAVWSENRIVHQPWWCWIVRNKNLDGLSDRKCDVPPPPLFPFSILEFFFVCLMRECVDMEDRRET